MISVVTRPHHLRYAWSIMPALINTYLACHLYNTDPNDRSEGPFVISQEAFDPMDGSMVNTVFLLRRDGTWVDEMVQVLLPDEVRFRVFFDSAAEAAEAMENLAGEPEIDRRVLTVAELRDRVSSLQGGGYITIRLRMAEKYREWRRQCRR